MELQKIHPYFSLSKVIHACPKKTTRTYTSISFIKYQISYENKVFLVDNQLSYQLSQLLIYALKIKSFPPLYAEISTIKFRNGNEEFLIIKL